MTLTAKTDHAAEGASQLITQFKDQSNFVAFLQIYLDQVQEIEDALLQVEGILTSIDAQVGDQLDTLGRLVGQEREGRTDADYLRWIRARMAINRSSGTLQELLTILGIVAPDVDDITIQEFEPAAFVVRLDGAFAGDAEDLADLVSEVRAAGIGAGLEYTTEADDDTFQFASGDTEEADVNAGFLEELPFLNGGFTAWTGDDPDNWTVLGETGVGLEISEVGSGQGNGGVGTGAANIYSAAGGSLLVLRQAVTGLEVGETYTLYIYCSFYGGNEIDVIDGNGSIVDTITGVGLKEITFTALDTELDLILGSYNLQTTETTIDYLFLEGPNGGVFAGVVEA